MIRYARKIAIFCNVDVDLLGLLIFGFSCHDSLVEKLSVRFTTTEGDDGGLYENCRRTRFHPEKED